MRCKVLGCVLEHDGERTSSDVTEYFNCIRSFPASSGESDEETQWQIDLCLADDAWDLYASDPR